MAKLRACSPEHLLKKAMSEEHQDYNRLIALVGIEKAEQTIKEMIESYLKKE